jgi:metal-responsive CopG/Arc/MetJ family transcriptional regulator
MTLDDDLVAQVDQAVKAIEITCSAFTRDVLRLALKQYQTLELKKKYRKGYEKNPVNSKESEVWDDS